MSISRHAYLLLQKVHPPVHPVCGCVAGDAVGQLAVLRVHQARLDLNGQAQAAQVVVQGSPGKLIGLKEDQLQGHNTHNTRLQVSDLVCTCGILSLPHTLSVASSIRNCC